jgi:hypothetical protein
LLLLIGSGSIIRLGGCLHCGHVLAKVNLLHSYERVCNILATLEVPLDLVDQMVLDCREGSSSSLAGSMRGELVFNLGSGLVLLVVVEPAPVEVALPALGVVSSSTTMPLAWEPWLLLSLPMVKMNTIDCEVWP